MRVCEVIKTLDVGGAESLLVERLLATRGAGQRTVVCLQATTPLLIERLRAAGVAVADLTAIPVPVRLPRLVSLVRGLRPDVLTLHSPLPAAVLRPAARLWRPRPVVITVVHNVRCRLPALLADRASGWLDDHTVAVSPQVARAITCRGARGLTVRTHGVDVARLRSLAAERDRTRRDLGVPPDARLIAHVANVRPAKNHRLLIEAAALVPARDPKALFLLAGSGVDRLARDLDHVWPLGPVPDARPLIAAADLLVLSSTHEGLPVVVMEALAAGVPVAATAVGGVPDLIRHGFNGMLARPGDPVALAEAVLGALRPGAHERLRHGARESAQLVDVSRTAEWFEDLYRDLLGRSGSARTAAAR